VLHLFSNQGQPVGHHLAPNAAILIHHAIFTYLRMRRPT
jgi:hypothetical protein